MSLKKKVFVGVILLAMAGLGQAAPVMVRNLRVSTLLHRMRLVFDLNKAPHYHLFTLHNPPRLVIDLSDASLQYKLTSPTRLRHLVRDIRTAKRPNHTLRIVLDLKQPMKYRAFKLAAEGKQPNRLVIDLIANNKTVIRTPQHKKLRNVIIVIDPGHGGKDSGAIGMRRTYEKNVVLAVGKDLQKLLDKQYGFTAKLTRSGDYFIPLRGRLAIERRDKADMFIAIHADAYKYRSARGASVFALSEYGATSEAARWLARKENESELGHTLADLQYKNKTLRSVLINLAQTASISTSLGVGDDIIHQLARVAKLHHGFVEQAGFMVLKEPDVPSLLVETGFISNPKEELQLRNPVHQQKIAKALMQGITDYYMHHPPPGTYLVTRHNRGH